MKQIGDMYIAAALLAYDCTLEEIDRSDPKRQKFNFEDTRIYVWVLEGNFPVHEELSPEEIEMKFLSKKLLFPPTYPDALRRIKSAIHVGSK